MVRFCKRLAKKNIKRVTALVLAFLTIFTASFSLLGTTAKADTLGETYADILSYALVVQTGVNDGKDISYFVVEYVDTDNNTRRAYIDPKEGRVINKAIQQSTEFDNVEANRLSTVLHLGYYAASYQSYLLNSRDALASNCQDIIPFRTYTPVKSIKSISFIVDATHTGLSNWDCLGMDVYHVSKYGSRRMTGYISDDVTIGIEGEQLASVAFPGADTEDLAFQFQLNGPGKIQITPGGSYINNDLASEVYLKTSDFDSDAVANGSTYMVKIDIADEYKAGLEEYMQAAGKKETLAQMKIAEPLVLTLRYKDTNGALKITKAPVLLSALTYAIEKGEVFIDSTTLVDLISQSGSLAFPVKMADFSELIDGELVYVASDNKLKELTGLEPLDDAKSKHDAHYKAFDGDSISIAGIQLYKEGGVSVVNNGAQLIVEKNGNPEFFFLASSTYGQQLSKGATLRLDFSPYEEGVNYEIYDDRIDNDRLYLLELTTGFDDIGNTVSDIDLAVSYFNMAGREKTVAVNLKEDCKSYYGYWKGKETEDVAYEEGILVGKCLYVLMETPEAVDYFSGVEFINNGSNNWGGSNFSIYKVNSISNILYKWRTDNTSLTNVDHYREVNGVDLYSEKIGDRPERVVNLVAPKGGTASDGMEITGTPGYIYVKSKGKSKLDFNSVKISDADIHDPKFFEHLYSMSYDYATKDHGFTVAEKNYDVTVTVGSDPYSVTNNDDCGSKNFFYFQLVFEHGVSAYVQANQQLESDGFRAGKPETFNISVNRDYGELVSVNIIPEISEDLGSPYDKLRIDKMEVVKNFGNGFGELYTISNVGTGWIGIESSDNSSTHSEKELAKNFLVDGKKTTAQLMFTINNGSYPRLKGDDYNQLKGTVYAVVKCRDINGKLVDSKRIDVVEAMYKFDGKEDLMVRNTSSNNVESAPELMFREGTVDRFIWDAVDVDRIEGIDFFVTNTTPNTIEWNVESVGVSLIKEGNIETDRTINSNREYVIDGGSMINIASSSLPRYTLNLDPNGYKKLSVQFDFVEGTSLAQASQSTMPYIISKDPASMNDTVNIYAFLDEERAVDEAHSFNVKADIIFSDPYGNSFFSEGTMTPGYAEDIYGRKQRVYELKNLGVKGFGTMGHVSLSATGKATCAVPIDYVVVQRMRNNVIIDTYLCYFATPGVNIAMSSQSTETYESLKSEVAYQLVTVEFGDWTEEVKALNPKKFDFAVALNYKSTLGGDEIYQTEYKYLTDQEILSIKAGDVVNLKFDVAGVKEITGLTVASLSFLQAEVKRATVGIYTTSGRKQNDDGTEGEKIYEVDKWYSFDDGVVVNNQSKTMTLTGVDQDTANTVSPLTFTIKTSEQLDGYNDVGVAKSDHVKMVINYTVNGNMRQYTVDDIMKNVVSGSFSAGKTAKVKLLATGINSSTIKSIAFIPSSDAEDRTVYWAVDSIGINFGDGQSSDDEKLAAKAGMLFTEGGTVESNTVYFSSARLSLSVYANGHSPEDPDDETYEQGRKLATATQGDSADITVDYKAGYSTYVGVDVGITNSSRGCKVIVVDNGGVGVNIEQEDDSFVIRLNGVTEDTQLQFKVVSQDNPDSFVRINMDVKYIEPTP